MSHLKPLFCALALGIMVACSPVADLSAPPEPLANFSLGFVVPQISDTVAQGPVSRSATAKEWEAVLTPAFEERFSRFEGDRLYHIGIFVDGYVLAQPGVPIILSPKSALIFRILLIDDETGMTLNDAQEHFNVFESFSGSSFIGSGLTQSKEEQLKNIAEVAAKRTERWLREQDFWLPTIEHNSKEGVL